MLITEINPNILYTCPGNKLLIAKNAIFISDYYMGTMCSSLSREEWVYIMDRGGVVTVLERIVSGGDKVVFSKGGSRTGAPSAPPPPPPFCKKISVCFF